MSQLPSMTTGNQCFNMVGNEKSKKRKRGIILKDYFSKELTNFITWLDRLGYAASSIKGHHHYMVHFFKFLESQDLKTPLNITSDHIDTYCNILKQSALKSTTIQNHFNTITRYCHYLEKIYGHKILYNDLVIEKEVSIATNILQPLEVAQLFRSLDNSPKGLLERSFLHLYYSCGLRSSEGGRILPKHIDYHKRLLYVAPGKNHHSRYIPLSAKVSEELKEYELYGRPLINHESPYFLVNPLTNNMSTQITGRMWQRIRKRSNLDHITLHGLRHSIATHLVYGGMPLESVQQFLGHNTLDATQIYVRMSHEILYKNETL